MSTSSNISLGALREQAKFRADLENNPFVSDREWNSYLTNSYKTLYDLLVASYGNDYHVATTYQFSVTNSQLYPLPDGTPAFQNTVGSTAAKFYKLLGLDLQYSASPSGWVTLKRFEFIERNRYAYPNSAINFNAYTNLRYRIEGNKLMVMPTPMTGQTLQVWYIPAPTNLQYILSCGQTTGLPTLTLSDTTGLTVGMNVAASTGVPDSTTILSLGSTTVTMSANAQATIPTNTIFFWDDAKTLDGIAGWEEFIIVDAAIKASIKEEDDIQPLLLQRQDLVDRIQSMSEGRDAGQAHHVSDVLGANTYGGMGGGEFGGGGWGDW